MNMDLLWVATKPPSPAFDGGRLVQRLTLEALCELGVRVTLVAPVVAPEDAARSRRLLAPVCSPHLVPVERKPRLRVLLDARPGGLPVAVALHTRRSVRDEVARRVAETRFAAVHVEQIHALPQSWPAAQRGIPLVLRAQNVESDLWVRSAALHPLRRALVTVEGERLAHWEGRAVRQVALTTALSPLDSERLQTLSGGAAVRWVPPPFPASLPPAAEPLPGRPALVHLSGGGWLPNRDAELCLLEELWPRVRRRLPDAVLHLFTSAAERTADGVVVHEPPRDSATAFPRGSILLVPLRVGSGVRMKILEAWARGVPVVASPEAVAGLAAESGRQLQVADGPEETADAVARLVEEEGLAERLVAAGRELLAREHAPPAVARRLVALYEEVAAAR